MKSTIINIVTGSALLLYQATPALQAQLRFPTTEPSLTLQTLQPNSPPLAAFGPKREGVIRIGVATPLTQMGQDATGAGLAEPVRALLLQKLTDPAIEAVPIAAVEPVQVDAESKSKACDYVLYSRLSQKKSGSTLGLLRSAAPMLSMVPMVGMAAGIGGMIAGQAAGVALSGGISAASAIKAKSELTLTYKLVRPGVTTAVAGNTFKIKAKTDGEDVITPMLNQAVAETLGIVVKKN